MINKVAIVAKPHAHQIDRILTDVCRWLQDKGIQTRVDEQIAHLVGVRVDSLPRKNLLKGADIVIVFGGDGTLISAAHIAPNLAVPILGVNVGGLGFLTGVTLDKLYVALSEVLNGQYKIDERIAIRAHVIRASKKLASYFAINDFVINKAAIARMIDISTYVNESFVAKHRADGLIISTPTGSTAYSLAAGGPILYPSLSVLVLSPICPHTLTNRPIVVPDDVQIKTILHSKGQEVTLTIDGQEALSLIDGDLIIIKKARRKLRLIQSLTADYFSLLRQKLSWGKNLGQA